MIAEIATISITAKCNFSCMHCFNKEVRDNIYTHMAIDKYINIVDHLESMSVLKLLLTGGEPMLHPQFPLLWEYAYKKGLKCEINTNLSLFNDEILATFKRYPPYMISVSLYGFSDSVYSSFTQSSSKFEVVKENLQKIVNNLDSRLNIKFIYTRQTKDDLSVAYEYYKNNFSTHNFDVIATIQPTILNDNEEKIDNCRVSVEDNINATWSIPEARNSILVKYLNPTNVPKRHAFPCGTIYRGLFVNPLGQISTCEKACASINIELEGSTIQKEFERKLFPWVNNINNNFFYESHCDTCEASDLCGNCYFTSKCVGNKLVYDPYICQVAKGLFKKCQQEMKSRPER